MVLGVISSEDHVIDPNFFSIGLKVNQFTNIEVIESVVVPWINAVAVGRPYTGFGASAPGHWDHPIVEEQRPQFWPAEVWPPNSPDLSLRDYYL